MRLQTMQSSLRARRESPASRTDTTVVAGRASGKRSWIPDLSRLFGSKAAVQNDPGLDANPLLAFPSETVPRGESVPMDPIGDSPKKPALRPAPPWRPNLVRLAIIVVIIVGLPSLGVLAVRRLPSLRFTIGEPRPGSLTIATRPVGSEVLIDGERRGATPLTLALTPGPHTITIRSGGDERVVPLTIAAGADVTQYFEMKAAEPVALFGRLSVVTDPPGARVAIDGRPRGTSPVVVHDLTPEEHKVNVTSDTGSVERTVMVTPGGTASVMFSLSKVSGPVGGWLSISAPFDVEVVENEDVIGTSGTSRIMMAAGRHDITLTNRSLGYHEARKIEVTAGKTMAIRVEAPKASVSVNARPWAEILLDGTSVGQTPIANLLVTVGSHEMVFRHPQLAERKQTIVVTAKGPNRIAADLTK
jgi:PEGA domain